MTFILSCGHDFNHTMNTVFTLRYELDINPSPLTINMTFTANYTQINYTMKINLTLRSEHDLTLRTRP